MDCEGSLGAVEVTVTNLPWCLFSNTTMATDEFQVRGGGCTSPTSAIKFTLHVSTIFGKISCNYENPAHLKGTFTTHPSDALLTLTKQKFNGTSGGLCPAEGFLDQSFTLTVNNNPVWIDKVTN